MITLLVRFANDVVEDAVVQRLERDGLFPILEGFSNRRWVAYFAASSAADASTGIVLSTSRNDGWRSFARWPRLFRTMTPQQVRRTTRTGGWNTSRVEISSAPFLFEDVCGLKPESTEDLSDGIDRIEPVFPGRPDIEADNRRGAFPVVFDSIICWQVNCVHGVAADLVDELSRSGSAIRSNTG